MRKATIKPNPGGQRDFLADMDHRYVALAGGWSSGKTWAGARKLLWLHLENNKEADVRSAVVAPTYSGAKDYDVPELITAAREMGLLPEWRGSTNEIVFPLQGLSSILVRTADKPSSITGWHVGAIWGDEAARWKADPMNPHQDALTQLKGRLGHPEAQHVQAMFTYTNEGDSTAIFQEFAKGATDHALYRASTRDNPMSARMVQDLEANLTPELAEQYIEGHAISLGGSRAYANQFDPSAHITDTKIEQHLPLCIALDWNIQPGMHALIGQYNEAGGVFVVADEIHRSRLDVRGVVNTLRDWIGQRGGWQWPELQVYGDATGKAEWAGTAQSCYDILAEGLKKLDIPYRIRTPKANPPVTDRINAVTTALRDMAGNVHIRIDKRCERLIADLRQVQWEDNGKGLSKRNPELTHASDALGYWVHYVRPTSRLRLPTSGRFGVNVG